MDFAVNRQFGQTIGRLIAREDLSYDEAYAGFCRVLKNEVSDMQQGAFLAALTAKGETEVEVSAGWQAVYELDTNKVTLPTALRVVDNCGTGMDSFKTFNISTAAAIVAAAGGITMARHGARAISSKCGTVDMAERLGVDVECGVDIVARSIKETGLGLFNGMSPEVHPMALGRILGQIFFGSPLNIAASLANPALPKVAVRGVYKKELILPVLQVMKSIGYTDVLVVYGTIEGSDDGMDEGSVCGLTQVGRLRQGEIDEFSFTPEECGLGCHSPGALAADHDPQLAARRMVAIISGQELGARRDAVLLNAALIFWVSGKTESINAGVKYAAELIDQTKAMQLLVNWVKSQNRDADAGLAKLHSLQEAL